MARPVQHVALTLPARKSIIAELTRGGAAEARWAHNPKVVGSNPTPATIEALRGLFSCVPKLTLRRECCYNFGAYARRGSSAVEQGTHKPLVVSSNLTLATTDRDAPNVHIKEDRLVLFFVLVVRLAHSVFRVLVTHRLLE